MAISSGDDANRLLGVEPFDANITVVHRIEIHKLRALAALAGLDSAAAVNQLTQAMGLAAHTGHRQTFIDEDATFGGLLDNAVARSGHRLRLNEQLIKPPESMSHARPPLVELLTSRELEVLRLLPSHLTNSEIGEVSHQDKERAQTPLDKQDPLRNEDMRYLTAHVGAVLVDEPLLDASATT